jgi:excisionase family DNA binding protein
MEREFKIVLQDSTLPEYLNVSEVASWLKMRRSTIYQLVHKRQIPFVKVNARKLLFEKQAIIDWINSQTNYDKQSNK